MGAPSSYSSDSITPEVKPAQASSLPPLEATADAATGTDQSVAALLAAKAGQKTAAADGTSV